MSTLRASDIKIISIIGMFFVTFILSPIIPFLQLYELINQVRLYQPLFLCFLFFYLISTLIDYQKKNIENISRLYLQSLLLFLSIILIQLFYYPKFFNEYVNYKEIYKYTIEKTILMSGVMFFLGSLINYYFIIFESMKFKRILYIGYVFFVAFIFYGIYLNPVKNINGFSIYIERYMNYLIIADSFAIFSLLIIAMTNKITNKVLLFALSTFCLSALYSRTSFVFFLITMLIYFTYLFFNRKNQKRSLLPYFLLILFIIIALFLIINSQSTENRVIHTLLNIENDGSLNVRNDIAYLWFKDIGSFWLSGSFLYEAIKYGEGLYIHNLLSFWSAYGLIPFLLFIFIIVQIFLKILKLLKKESNVVSFLFLIMIFMTLSIIFSRAYTYIFIWFLIAAGANINLNKREVKI